MTASYEQKKQRLTQEIRAARGDRIRLGKATSNLFRDRVAASGRALDVRDFNQVLTIDTDAGWIEVEGMTPYVVLADAALAHGVMPAVVPQLKSITIGGAVSGVGIESSSFRFGLPHETVLAMDVLLGHGEVVTCTPENEHRELFFGLPNSYGTLGYILKLRIRAVPVKPYVALTHLRIDDPDAYFEALAQHSQRGECDFIDGVVFRRGEQYLTLGRFVAEAPHTSDYTYQNIYYRSIRKRDSDYLTTRDYLWRWDTDWFWCSKNLYAQHPLVRRLLGRERLNSATYTRIMRWNSRWGVTRRINRLLCNRPESVIQDVDIPVHNAAAFLDFFQREIGIEPLWICPVGHCNPAVRYDLFPLDPYGLYVNFGFWDVVPNRKLLPEGYFNRLVEHKVMELGGIKSLYSDSYFTAREFWSIYNKPRYQALKERYDPAGRFKDLYQKTVLRQ